MKDSQLYDTQSYMCTKEGGLAHINKLIVLMNGCYSPSLDCSLLVKMTSDSIQAFHKGLIGQNMLPLLDYGIDILIRMDCNNCYNSMSLKTIFS